MKIAYSPKFLRSFEKLQRDIQNEFRAKETIFRIHVFDPRLRTHKLKGRREWSFLVTHTIRVIFVFEKGFMLFVNIGDHSIYRK